MKKWMMLINILVFLGLAACQGAKETIVEKHYVGSDGLPVPPSNNAEGGIDGGGGGNGVNGKPLESYRTDINQMASYKRVEEKVISKLKTRFPNLAADLLHISEERAWYFVPTELKNLPAYRIGVSFKTDQFALQKLKEVWFNKLIFDTMSEDDQDVLVLHELVMGVRLLEFTNLLDRCLANISPLRLDAAHLDKYKEARKTCFKVNRNAADLGDSIGLGKNIVLEEYDYDTIRELTSTLLSKVDNFDAQELEDWMAIRKFRSYQK